MSGRWADSDRVRRLPPGWKKIRARVLARDPICKLCGVRPSTHCDHIHAKTDDHAEDRLQGVCATCHGLKSSAEGNAAPRDKPSRRRPPEAHPGLKGLSGVGQGGSGHTDTDLPDGPAPRE